MKKTCTRCGVEKDEEEFCWSGKAHKNRCSKCRECHAAVQKAWRHAHPDRAIETRERFRQKHRKRLAKYQREWGRAVRSTFKGYLRVNWMRKRTWCAARGVPFDLTLEHLLELFELQKGRCALTGIELEWGRRGRATANTLSLDRIDPEKGYVIGNVRMVTLHANRARGRNSDTELLELADRLRDASRGHMNMQEALLRIANDAKKCGFAAVTFHGNGFEIGIGIPPPKPVILRACRWTPTIPTTNSSIRKTRSRSPGTACV